MICVEFLWKFWDLISVEFLLKFHFCKISLCGISGDNFHRNSAENLWKFCRVDEPPSQKRMVVRRESKSTLETLWNLDWRRWEGNFCGHFRAKEVNFWKFFSCLHIYEMSRIQCKKPEGYSSFLWRENLI
jgi:hypothetical protein